MMDFILNENDAEDVSIPLKYLHLELTLKKLTESKRVSISFEKVFFHVARYFDDHKAMKEGLLFLHNSFRIFYFIEFSHLMFGSPRYC